MLAHSIRDLPEIVGLDARRDLIRIPPELDVPITPRVRSIIDSADFRRLAKISQLGLVSRVYPAAHHQRFEHSLGVYRLSLLYLKQLAHETRFTSIVSPGHAERLILAALLHDIGHWPFCHLIEDLRLPDVPCHEALAREFLTEGELSERVRNDWSVSPEDVANLLEGRTEDAPTRLLSSILSGPIDVDKLDYLMRDSLHAGVPYGRNFDQTRLIGSLCVNHAGDGLALSKKGRTAAEMLVFARYVMFSEVYWHHAVRSATAMFQRAFFRRHQDLNLTELFRLDEQSFVNRLVDSARDQAVVELLDGLFGTRRKLYKRAGEYSCSEDPERYRRLARQPYARLVCCSEQVAQRLTSALKQPVLTDHVLIDAPPSKLEVQFDVDVHDPKRGDHRPLVDVSPVVKTLAETQFDDHVKRVRLFLHPDVRRTMESLPNWQIRLQRFVDDAWSDVAADST